MAIPILDYAPTTQNQRVMGFEIGSDEQPKIYSLSNAPQGVEVDEIIAAAYRQVFNEQQTLNYYHQTDLESQLRFGQITVRDFVRGLVLSDSFRDLNYASNNNYQFAEMCLQRLLGRTAYNKQEKLAWSIVIATKGVQGFIDALLNSDEYLDNFGEDAIPYQRRRILPQRDQGEVSFAHTPRYGKSHLKTLKLLGNFRTTGNGVLDDSAGVYRVVILAVPAIAVLLLLTTLALGFS